MDAGETGIGQIIAGRYRIESLLGRGGMGLVYRAHDLTRSHDVALKVVLPSAAQDTVLPRFLREARIAARLDHPRVVRVFDSGRAGNGHAGYYLSMELVSGVPLSRLLDAALPVDIFCGLICQVLDALAYVHARGVLHRDIKPENILVTRCAGGELAVKVADFGLAAAIGGERYTQLTQDGQVFGTPVYMAPEQALGNLLAGPQLDLYPIGVILFRFLTGDLPFSGNPLQAMLHKTSQDPVWPTAGKAAGVAPELVGVVMRLLSRLPEERFQMSADARSSLTPFSAPAVLSCDDWARHSGLAAAEQEELSTMLTADITDTPAVAGSLAGREPELQQLEQLAAQVEDGAGLVVIITGEVGIGKTALLEQFGYRMAEAGRFLMLRAVFQTSARDGVRGALERLLGTIGRPTPEVAAVVREYLRRQGIDSQAEAREMLGFLRPETLPAGETMQRGFAVLGRVLRRLAQERPVLLALDDLHLAGAEAADLAAYLQFEVSYEPYPLLVVATIRFGSRSEHLLKALADSNHLEGRVRHTINLEPLPQQALAGALVQGRQLSAAAAREVARRAGGNPLFALHLARAHSTEILQPTPTGASDLPVALRRVLENSLQDRLATTSDPDFLFDVLVDLAALGDTVRSRLLEQMVRQRHPGTELDAALDELIDLDLLTDTVEAGCGCDLISFTHGLMRESILAGLSGRRARRVFRRAAEVRTAMAGQRADADAEAGAIGDHWDRAGSTEQAVSWWLRAADWEVRTGHPRLGVAWGRKALARLPSDDDRYGLAIVRLGRLLADLGDYREAIEVLERAIQSDPEPDPDLILIAGDFLADVLENTGSGDAWVALLERMEQQLPAAGAAGQRACQRALSLWYNSQGRPDKAIPLAEAATQGAEPGVEALRSWQRLAYARALAGDPEGAAEAAQRALDEAGNHPLLRVYSLRITAVVGVMQGAGTAYDQLQEALGLARRYGWVDRVPVLLSGIGDTYLIDGDLSRARDQYRESIRIANELGTAWPGLMSSYRMLLCDLVEGVHDGALSRTQEIVSRSHAQQIGAFRKIETIVTLWVRALSGEVAAVSREIQRELTGDVMASFDRGLFLESVARLREQEWLAEPETTSTGDVAAMFDLAERAWRRCGNTKRAAACRARKPETAKR